LSSPPPTTAADTGNSATPLGLTGSAATPPTWNTGDQFSPNADFTGAGYLYTTTPAVTPNQNFTISAWVKPTSTSDGDNVQIWAGTGATNQAWY
jgi:hypothetical protein